jgi:hypothetical protein
VIPQREVLALHINLKRREAFVARARINPAQTAPGLAEIGHEVLRLAADPGAEAAVTADPLGQTNFASLLDLAGRQLLIHYDKADVLNIVIPYYPSKDVVPLDVKAAEELLGLVTIMGCGD